MTVGFDGVFLKRLKKLNIWRIIGYMKTEKEKNQNIKVEERDFYSGGTRCSALYYKVSTSTPKGIIVMANGLGGVKELWLNKFADFFCKNGYDCLLFDYRNFGTSDGKKRQLVNVKDQIQDFNSAVDFVRKNFDASSKGVILFGTSFSGGHVIKLLSERNDIKMAISQCPYTNTLATLKTFSVKEFLKFIPPILLDLLSCLTGYHPFTLKLTGGSDEVALMKITNYKKYLEELPKGLIINNKVPARTILQFFRYSPGKYFKDINKPIYVAACTKDSLAPTHKTIELAKKCEFAEIKEYDCGHFDIYFDGYFKKASEDYLRFLDKNNE